jgi:hypothetical protein
VADFRTGFQTLGELTHSYSVENGEVKMTKQELITMIENAGPRGRGKGHGL